MSYQVPSLEDMMQAGVHFGHRVMRWHPKMKPFIYGEKDGVHIINLVKTADKLSEAVSFLAKTAENGGVILFVGTKRQAKDIVEKYAGEANLPYVSNRWLGGLLTNFATIKQNLARLHELAHGKEENFPGYTKKEALVLEEELTRLMENFGGIKDLTKTPDVMVILDLKHDDIAVKEARKLKIPIVGLADTNVDPDLATIAIPANDDALTSLELLTKLFVDVITSTPLKTQAENQEAARDEQAAGPAAPKAPRKPAAKKKTEPAPVEAAVTDTKEEAITEGK
jgi:small subunit ribosomal protein S2